ncbi:hypothetical protein H5368_06985 [Luteimonas sp. MC1782]|uniref:hypothetical protein n=1 Tax=Luteimonas sp. MC1782 TaxID=2760305 RepID=UPI0016012FBA|nr:hypothetical protein [Luteimonas sp. MC1782]MBB1472772.1 hypothetical protein [Luteimonas sp. MC1782]
MTPRTAYPTALAVAITLMCVLAGCGPRAPADDATQAASANAPGPAGDAAARDPGAASGDATPTAPTDGDDVLSGVPQSIPLPARTTPTMPLPDATEVTYLCADGSDLRVRYGGGQARVSIGLDNVATLALSPEASAEHGGEVYVGQGQGLRRIGGVVEFDPGKGEDAIRRCREASSTA